MNPDPDEITVSNYFQEWENLKGTALLYTVKIWPCVAERIDGTGKTAFLLAECGDEETFPYSSLWTANYKPLPDYWKGRGDEWLDRIGHLAREYFQQHFKKELNAFVSRLLMEAGLKVAYTLEQERLDAEGDDGGLINIERERQTLIRRIEQDWGQAGQKGAGQRLGKRDGRLSEFEFNPPLSLIYPECRFAIHDARQIATDAKKAKNPRRQKEWKFEVARLYPTLDDDLVMRLDKDRSSWTDDLREKIQDDENAPADIAIEWAARQAGEPFYKPYSLSLERLYSRMKKERAEKRARSK